MGTSKSRHEKREHWSIGITDIINAVQLEKSNEQRATVSIENKTSENDPPVQQMISEREDTRVVQSTHVENEESPSFGTQKPVAKLNPSEKKTFAQISQPSNQDLLIAAYKFNNITRRSNIEFAVIGGFSARIFGGNRITKSLDILIAPQVSINNKASVRQIIDELFRNNPNVLEYTRLDRQGHIIVIHENVGVAINFVDSVNNIYHFPDLVAETHPDGTPWSRNDPEPTWSYRYIQPARMQTGSKVPILLPRLLLQQRVLLFTRPHEKYELNRKKNDVNDIAIYLTSLYGSEHQSFTDEEARELLSHIRNILRFADSYQMEGLDVAKWRWINIPLRMPTIYGTLHLGYTSHGHLTRNTGQPA